MAVVRLNTAARLDQLYYDDVGLIIPQGLSSVEMASIWPSREAP